MFLSAVGCSDEKAMSTIDFAYSEWSNPSDFTFEQYLKGGKGYLAYFTDRNFSIEYNEHDMQPCENNICPDALYSNGTYVYDPPLLRLHSNKGHEMTYKIQKNKMILISKNIPMTDLNAIEYPDVLYFKEK